VKRPALIWFTQGILVPLFLAATLGLIAAVSALGQPGVKASLVALDAFVQIAIASLLAWLFYGLMRRRRWAWRAAIAFGICLALFAIGDRLLPLGGTVPLVAPTAEQRMGQTIGRILGTIIVVFYPIRLYLSRSVRAFFGVTARDSR
jgi:hypothetical protein